MFTDRPPVGDDAGMAVFQRLTEMVSRCVDAGRFDSAEVSLIQAWAGELWTMSHGMVTLALTGLIPEEQVRFLLADMTYRLAVGYGDERAAARHSIDTALSRGRPTPS